MPTRLFTRGEAEELLPRLTELLERMRALKQEYERFGRKVGALSRKIRTNGHAQEGEVQQSQIGLETRAAEVNGLVEDVQALGCEVKGIDEGLIDFRSEMEGREVYLCWKLGEERIEWWHEIDTGFAGRRPIADG